MVNYLVCWLVLLVTNSAFLLSVEQSSIIDSGFSKAGEYNYLYVHGIAESHKQAYWYTKGKTELPYLIDGRLFTYDFPDVTRHFWRVNWTQTGLGQHNEIMGLKQAYEQARALLKAEPAARKELILVGMSRGATTILNFLGLYQPAGIQAAVVESPFESTKSLVDYQLKRFKMYRIPGAQTVCHGLMSAAFWKHSTTGACAGDAVPLIDKSLPLLLICSQEDTVVPASSTISLYKILRASGHKKVHIFIAQKGKHGKILHGPDGKKYQAVVHAFYKNYGLPYEEAFASAGQELFATSQPII